MVAEIVWPVPPGLVIVPLTENTEQRVVIEPSRFVRPERLEVLTELIRCLIGEALERLTQQSLLERACGIEIGEMLSSRDRLRWWLIGSAF